MSLNIYIVIHRNNTGLLRFRFNAYIYICVYGIWVVIVSCNALLAFNAALLVHPAVVTGVE